MDVVLIVSLALSNQDTSLLENIFTQLTEDTPGEPYVRAEVTERKNRVSPSPSPGQC